jgi:hemerythrin-like domain-containing protein
MTTENQTETIETVQDSELKRFIVNYTGTVHEPKDEMITVQMIIDTLATEFPELVYIIAEENFIRGYQLGLDDATVLEGNTDKDAVTAE